MIRTSVIVCLIILFSFANQAIAKEIAGVQLPEELNYKDVNLVLNGAGIRSKLFFDIYVSALYLGDRSQDAEKILRDDMPMGLRLHIVSGLIDKDDLKDAVKEGFENATGGNTQPIQSQIDQFLTLMDSEIQDGDAFNFIYHPDSGLNIFKNGQLIDAIKGLNFKRAFFGIWIGGSPVDDDLKDEMLGL